MHTQSSLSALAAAILLLTKTSQAQMTLSAPASVPSGASPTVNPAFPAYAFEERSFYSYTNFTLSKNLLAQAAARTNSRPAIRVGGNSLNSANYVSDPSTSIIIPERGQNLPIPGNITLGPAFWDCFNAFPNAQYIVDVPMNDFAKGNKSSDVGTTTTMAEDAWKIIGSDNILAFELGNEPNSYPGTYEPSDYATQFQQYSDSINEALGLSSNDPIYLAGGLSYPALKDWNAPNMFSSGLNSMKSRFSSFSVHFYQGQDRASVNLQDLLSHSRIVKQVAIYVPQIQYVRSLSPSIPFDFGETACSVGQIQNPDYVLERALGAALWQVDFMLYTMTLGVNRVHMQSGYGFEFSLWQPSAFGSEPAAVYANYYAQIFAGDFIGKSGKMQAVQLDTGNSDTLTAYAAYEAGVLKRVAIANLGYFDGTQQAQSARSSQSFTIAVPEGVSNVTMQTLTAPNGATEIDTANITWAGMTYTLENDGMAQSVGNASTVLPVTNGHVTLSVAQSQAVMVFFGAQGSSSAAGTSSVSSTATASSTGRATSVVATGTAISTGAGASASATATNKNAASGLKRQAGRVLGAVYAAVFCVLAVMAIV